jgi:HAE1 family hydrophobic/amphiphilic exporter-1
MIRFFAKHPTASNLLMAGFLVLGLLSLPRLLIETFPKIPIKEVTIRVPYPGATAADVERTICRRIEDAVDGVENVEEIQCDARENVAIATATMFEGNDVEQFLLDIDREIGAINDFPESVEEAVVEQSGRMSFVASLVVTGIADRTQLKVYADDLKDRLLRFGGIPKVEVKGFSDRQIRIEVDDAAARELGLTLEEIANTVSRQNINLPAGEIVSRDGTTLLRFSDERLAADAYRSVIIRSSSQGGQIRLGDIARITDRFEDDEVETRLNGEIAAVLDVYMTRQDDLIQVIDRLKAFAGEERHRAPPSIKLTVIRDGSIALKDRLRILISNSIQGLILVVAAMWIFFGGRQAFWIGLGLPVSFLGAVALMVAFGITINMLSLVGLLIVIGIVMDDAIVISENIATKRQNGLPALEAAIEGTKQVLPGVMASFLTTAAVFGALAFLSGDLGKILRVVPIVMLMVLCVSLVEAFLILPNHLSHGSESEKQSRITRKAEAGIGWVRDHFIGPVASWAVRYRYMTLGIAVMMFLGTLSLLLGGIVKFQAFPDVQGDQIEARIELPSRATLSGTRAVVEETVAALQRVSDALKPGNADHQPLTTNVLVRFNENVDAGTNGAHLATINVDLITGALRSATNEDIMTRWREELPKTLDVRQIILTESTRRAAGRPIELRLSHPDLAILDMASADLQAWLSGYKGVYNISDDLTAGKPELSLSLRDGAGSLGLDARSIANQIRAAFNGIVADEIQIGTQSYEIDVRLTSSGRDSLEDIEQFTIETPQGNRVPLGSVANASYERGYTRINRINRIPTVTVTGDILSGIANANEIVKNTQKAFLPKLLASYPGLSASTEGQNAKAGKTQGSMITSLGIGLIFVFCLLSFQFRSYAEPFVVMTLIPFALIGAVLGHYLMGIDFSLPSTLGFISLTGIVVNDSILLVEFIKNHHAPGITSVSEIAPAGAKGRFRAILLTSITTIVGMMPLLFETSPQAQVLVPLVTSIAFGLLGTTLMIVFVVPAFYTVLDDFGLTSLARERKQTTAAATGTDPIPVD